MALDPKTMTDASSVRRLLANAVRLNEDHIAQACRKRLYDLETPEVSDPVEKRLWQAVAAYEQTLREKHGRKQPAAYTRRKIAVKGAVQTLTDWALEKNVTPGFEALVSSGSAEFTGEYVVVEFSERFSPEAVTAAKKKLSDHGVEFPQAER